MIVVWSYESVRIRALTLERGAITFVIATPGWNHNASALDWAFAQVWRMRSHDKPTAMVASCIALSSSSTPTLFWILISKRNNEDIIELISRGKLRPRDGKRMEDDLCFFKMMSKAHQMWRCTDWPLKSSMEVESFIPCL